MKKILTTFTLIALTGFFQSVSAQTVGVKSLNSFSTDNPPAKITVELLEDLSFDNKSFKAGSKLTGNIVNVIPPQRLKRNAKFSFKPVSYVDLNGKSNMITTDLEAVYTEPFAIDKGHLAKSAAVGVGNMFVKGFGMGVAAVEGAVHNENGNRLKSSAVSVYEASPVSYVDKGEDLQIAKDDVFYLNFPEKDKDNVVVPEENGGKNFKYTIEKE